MDPIIISCASQSLPDYLIQKSDSSDDHKLPIFAIGCQPKAKKSREELVIPTCFNLKTKSNCVELEPGNLQAAYTGQGKGGDIDCGTIKGNLPVPTACGIFYYEITIISKGRDGYIGLGFTTSLTVQQRLPGLDDNTWGYHAHDGKKYHASNSGVVYGPSFSTGDIIGCCINFGDLSISFTRNGIMLGNAWTGLKILEQAPVYPIVGLRTPGEIIRANFGQAPFKFDIDQYCKDEKVKLWRSIDKTQSSGQFSHSNLNMLIAQYLVNQGFSETAKSFYANAIEPGNILDETGNSFDKLQGVVGMESRKTIIALVSRGHIYEAIEEISSLYPTLLHSKPFLHAQLLCLQFVEIIRSLHPIDEDITMDSVGITENLTLLDAINLARHINSYFSDGLKLAHDAIDEIQGLVCYSNPYESPLSYVLDLSAREKVANFLNSAMLEFDKSPPRSSLETLFRQVLCVEDQMYQEGIGSRNLVDLGTFIRN